MSLEEKKNTRLVELRTRLEDIDAHLMSLAEKSHLSEEEEQSWEDKTAERDVLYPEYQKLEERAARIADIKNKTFRQISGLPDKPRESQDLFGMDVRTMDWRTARDGALRILDDREQNYPLRTHQADLIEAKVRSAQHSDLARRIVVTENPYYQSAFHKMMTRGNTAVLTDEERIAMLRYEEYRAQSEGSTTSGGFAIPVFIDPSVILTDQETDNPFLRLARQI